MPTYYKGSRLLDIFPSFESPEGALLDDFTFESVGKDVPTPWKVTSVPRRKVDHIFVLNGVSAIRQFRLLLEDLRGRRYGVWVPVFLRDYVITQNQTAGDTTITVQKVGLSGAVSSFSQFKSLALINGDFIEPHGIASVAVSGANEVITLTEGIGSNMVAGSTIGAGLMFCRIENDPAEFSFTSTDVAEVKLTFNELPQEYVTPHPGFDTFYLYQVTRGATVWRYTDFPVTVIVGGFTWTASDISHDKMTFGLDFTSEPINLQIGTVDATSPARYFLDRDGSEITTLQIFESSLASLTYDSTAPIFSAQVGAVEFKQKGVVNLGLSSFFRYGEVQLPQVMVQRTCVHRLYSSQCGASEVAFTTSGTISALQATDPPYVEATAFGAAATAHSDANWFALGKVKSGVETRICMGQSGNRLFLNAPFKSAIVGDAVTAAAGCDKRVQTCNTKFSNLVNFLGFPFIPSKNPQFKALEVPKTTGGKK